MRSKKIGRYEIKSELGRGGMATVYRGWDPLFEREVAVKVLPPELLHSDPQFKMRFEREAKIIASLEHPSIVPVYDVGDDNGQPYFVMRCMSGGSLSDRIKAKKLTVDDAIKILGQLAPGLDEAHAKGIVHRDLKPSNILFDAKGTPYISDFGIAKFSQAQSSGVAGSAIIGTPAYMAPEQAQGTGVDGRTDIYAVGIILFEMLTGKQPYEADSPMAVAFKHITDPVPNIFEPPALPEAVDTVIHKAMAKNKDDRFSTATELVQMLKLLNGEKDPNKMGKSLTRKLRVFLCHASEDKLAVREIYQRLVAESWIEPWLDEESLLPGQDWNLEINKATRDADAIIICLSKVSVAKEGYLNKEIRRALDIADEKPEGMIYVIPLRLDDCNPSFERLKKLHWVDYFTLSPHEKLLKALRVRANVLKIEDPENQVKRASKPKAKAESYLKKEKPITRIAFPWLSDTSNVDLDLYRFIQIPPTEEVPYAFYIGKYPVTNAQYERFLNAPDFADRSLWVSFPKYNENGILIGKWGTEGWDWLQEETKGTKFSLKPRYWDDYNFGISNTDNPVVGISWYEANAYCG
jgi:serine/threonine-protein kinase